MRLQYTEISPYAPDSRNHHTKTVEIQMCNSSSWKNVFQWLRGFEALEHLAVRDSSLTDEDCLHLHEVNQVVHLNLEHNKLTPKSAVQFESLVKLTMLNVCKWVITEYGTN